MTQIMQGILVLVLLAAAAPAGAQTHAYKTGEVISGDIKTCHYEANGNVYTRLVGRSSLCPLSIPVTSPLPRPYTVTAYNTGELVTGQTKQCFYDYAGDGYTRTVHSYQLCPLSIKVRR